MTWPAGFRAGHWTDAEAGTGCTVVLPPPGTVAAVDVRGGGPSTLQTDLLAPQNPLQEVTALLLTGGSAFGLGATAGVVDWCVAHGLGYDVAVTRVPIVPTAVIFDLGITGNARHPGPADAALACDAAVEAAPPSGSVGAGTGATVGKLFGREGWCKGGFGVAAARTLGGVSVAVLAVVNAFGDILDERGGILAGAWRQGEGFADARRAVTEITPGHPRLVEHTTLGVVLTDGALTKADATQVARMASAGMSRVVAPVHTPLDGDVVFSLASGARPATAFAVGVTAATLMEEAIRTAVRSATAVRGVPTALDRRVSASA